MGTSRELPWADGNSPRGWLGQRISGKLTGGSGGRGTRGEMVNSMSRTIVGRVEG